MTYSLKNISIGDYHRIHLETGARGATIGNDFETGRALYDYQFDYLVKRYGETFTEDKNARIEFADGEIIPLENFG